MIGVGLFIAKKNDLLSNKRLIGIALLSILILTLPALLGFLNYNFMPFGYIVLVLFYMMAGYFNTKIVNWVFKGKYKFRHEIMFSVFITLVAMMLFAMLFNICNELQYGFTASTCMLSFLFVSIFIQTYKLFLYIPDPVYKIWKYSLAQANESYENIDYSKLKLVTIEIFRNIDDAKPLRIKAKVPDQMPFGDWVKRLIDDYNTKNPLATINHNSSDENVGWIFYAHNYVFLPKKYIDCDATIAENKLKDNWYIIAKRVTEIL